MTVNDPFVVKAWTDATGAEKAGIVTLAAGGRTSCTRTSAVAAYGSFVAPTMIGGQIKAGTPENAMYGFAVFYAVCVVVNWWFYLRKDAYIKNP